MDSGRYRLALVHDWLTGMRGGEKCLEPVCRRWPDAPLYTLIHQRGSVSPVIENRDIHTSILQHLPGIGRYYRYTLPFMPRAARWTISGCDLVLSFSHCIAKAALPPAGVPHICYCFTPMRYAWHMRQSYFRGQRGLKRLVIGRLLARLREWDRATAARVSHFVAISRTVQERIRECYGRDSVVIYPPVDTDFYSPAPVRREDYFLVAGAFAPYKRLDIAIEACNRLKKSLVIIGTGQDEHRLQRLAGPTVQFLGWQPDEVIRDHYRRCRALLFPGEEDFGIVPLEAQACGSPVIAFGKGGATETVVPWDSMLEPTGIWFGEQSVDAMVEALSRFDSASADFDARAIARQAHRFNRQRFENEMFAYIQQVMAGSSMPMHRAA